MHSVHPLIYIFTLIMTSMITSLSIDKYINDKTKNRKYFYTSIIILSNIIMIYLMYKLYLSPYNNRYNYIWFIMSFILWSLYNIITEDKKITSNELIGYVVSVVGMIIIFREN